MNPEDPRLGGELEVFVAGGGESFPRSAFDPGAKVAGNRDRVIRASGIEDNPLGEGVDLAQATWQVLGLVEAEGADGDGKAVRHHGAGAWGRETSDARRATV